MSDARKAPEDRFEVKRHDGRDAPAEGEQPGCTGAGDCPATAHTHGCYADTQGHCEHPEGHGWTPPGERVKPSVDDVAREAESRFPVPLVYAAEYRQEAFIAGAQWATSLLPGRAEAEVPVVPDSADVRERIKGVLREHDCVPDGSLIDGDLVVSCRCGETFADWDAADDHMTDAVLAAAQREREEDG